MRSIAAALLIALSTTAFAAPPDESSIARDINLGSWNGTSGPIAASSGVSGGQPFEALALHFSSSKPSDADPVAVVRASADGATWSDWIALTIDGDSTDRSESRYATGIVHFGAPMQHLQVSFDGMVDRVIATVFPPVERHESAAQSWPAVSENYRFGSVAIRARSEWGCPDGEGSRWTPAYTTITHELVHHTAGANSVADWDAEMRSIWYLHTVTNGWGDIGYNYLIDPNGVIYEGRAGGNGAIGAHFSCRNSGTAGVALLGTYTSVSPTSAALTSLRRILAEITRRNNVDPAATVKHASSGLMLPTIAGHRDGNSGYPTQTCTSTECPGNVLYAMLPQIRADVACAPSIVADPSSTAIRAGSSATLAVNATGENLQYQWYAGESGNTAAPVVDATSASVTVAPMTTTSYWVRVTNSCASADSATAIVNLTGAVRVRPTRP